MTAIGGRLQVPIGNSEAESRRGGRIGGRAALGFATSDRSLGYIISPW